MSSVSAGVTPISGHECFRQFYSVRAYVPLRSADMVAQHYAPSPLLYQNSLLGP